MDPLVLVWEDIHWADEGMLDLIEYLVAVGARAGAADLPRPGRAARASDRLGRRQRATSTTLFLEPLGDSRDARADRRRCCTSPAPATEVVGALAERARRATRCSPRRWCAASPRRTARRRRSCPTPCRALLAARLDSLEPFERRLRRARRGRSDGPSGRARSSRSPSAEGGDLAGGAARRCARRTSSSPVRAARSRASGSSPSSTC